MCHFYTCAWLAGVNSLSDNDDVIKRKHFPRYWSFVRGIHRSPVNSPHKGQWCGALMFSLICAWINAWVNIGEAGDLRRHRAHYDVTVMMIPYSTWWYLILWSTGTELILLPHMCVKESGQHWFRRVVYFAPSRCLNQCWVIVNRTIRANFSESLIKIKNFWFTKISSAKWRLFWPRGSELKNPFSFGYF